MKTLLHIGCKNLIYDGFINSDKEEMDVTQPWPYADNSVDGIVSMHLMQQLTWRELVVAFKESFRVLKVGRVMRIGTPMIENGKPLEHLLGWNNINLFNYDLLNTVLTGDIGYSKIKLRKYRETSVPEFAQVDNRADHTFFIEVTK